MLVFICTVVFFFFFSNLTVFCSEHSVFDIKIGETTVQGIMPSSAFKLIYKCQK